MPDKPNRKSSAPVRTWWLTVGGFSLSLLATCALAGYAWWIAERQAQAVLMVHHTQDVLAAMTEVRATLNQTGRQMRDYVITGNGRDMERYGDSLGRLKAELARVRALTADNPAQQARVDDFGAVLQARLQAVGAILEARRNQGFAAAQALIDADAGNRRTAVVLERLARLEAEERNHLQIRSDAEQAAMRHFQYTAAALVLLVVLALALLYLANRQRQAAQQEWRRSEERFALMAESAVEYGIFMLDPTGVVTTWNPGAERIKGYRAEEIIGRHFSVFYPDEDIAQGKPAQELRAATDRGHTRDEGWRLRKDGSRFWADVVITALRDDTGTLRGYAKLTRDITSHRQLEDALHAKIAAGEQSAASLQALNDALTDRVALRNYQLEISRDQLEREISSRSLTQESLQLSESRLRGILDSAMDAIITIDESEHIVLFNAAAEKVFGCPQKEAIGAPLTWFIPARFRAAHADHVRLFAAAGTASRRMGTTRIVTGLRRSGEEFPIDASISQVSGVGGRFFTVILRDVTERVRAEEALRRSKDDLRALAAIASTAREQEKSRIARELHDDLAQCLSALKMDVDWALERVAAEQAPLRARLQAMQGLIVGAIVATRRIAADLRPLILDDLGLVPAVHWLIDNFGERTGIVCELAFEPPDLQLHDPHATAIFRILQESLNNIAKHAHASLVQVTVRSLHGEVLVTVRDNGRGFRADDPRKPDSMGLAGLRERAYLLEGQVSFDTAPGRGTTVEVRVPLPVA